VIVGAGDPSLRSVGSKVGGTGASLSPASLEELAAATARALRERRVRRVRIGFDDSLFVGPALHPSWSSSFPAGGVVAPVSALQVDQGRRTPTGIARVSDPAAAAAARFAELLADQGIKVRGGAARVGGSSGATRLAFVESPSVGVLVERTLASSDNDYAEALGRLAARAAGEPAGFAGVGRRAEGLLAGLGVPIAGARFADASGLSRRNRLTPGQLTALLEVTASRYGHVASGLPVAGATGSLRDRFGVGATEPGRGVVRAKTGTLTGVVGLAGYTSRPDGRLLAFAFLDDDSVGPPLAMRRAVDQAAAELAACDCAAG
jgi:D-alanyl-D-alanine carboxypeptidase/D-alanyl-D-alanine-endopeptidase (penicillin-binding protein 4)